MSYESRSDGRGRWVNAEEHTHGIRISVVDEDTQRTISCVLAHADAANLAAFMLNQAVPAVREEKDVLTIWAEALKAVDKRKAEMIATAVVDELERRRDVATPTP